MFSKRLKRRNKVLKMKTCLMVIAFLVIFATVSEAGYGCDNWKNSDGVRCTGCVFTKGDMAGKCKRSGQYAKKTICIANAGIWCA